MWFEGYSKEREWDLLLGPLVSQEGSKILITSRRDTFPTALCCGEVVRLEDVKDAEFFCTLQTSCFLWSGNWRSAVKSAATRDWGKDSQTSWTITFGRKVVGSHLSRKKDVTSWRDALAIKNLSEPRRALLWSYEKLDPHLQRCFSYCSLFPEGRMYDIREVVHLWVVEGL